MSAISPAPRARARDAVEPHPRAWPDAGGAALIVGVVVMLGLMAWNRRWATEDAFIDFRVIDNVLHGHGPVFNVGERVEAYTSPLWVAVLGGVSVLTGRTVALPWIAVVGGGLLTLTGVVAGCAGALRLQRRGGRGGLAVPAGALVLAVLPPMWDFATSGLETGLEFFWLGACFWATAAPLRDERVSRVGRLAPVAVLLGVGPLVRPDFAVFSAAWLLGLLVVVRLGWRDRARLLAVALAAPAVYQVFRMGYLAAVLPNTALAKEAGSARWDVGWHYLRDLALDPGDRTGHRRRRAGGAQHPRRPSRRCGGRRAPHCDGGGPRPVRGAAGRRLHARAHAPAGRLPARVTGGGGGRPRAPMVGPHRAAGGGRAVGGGVRPGVARALRAGAGRRLPRRRARLLRCPLRQRPPGDARRLSQRLPGLPRSRGPRRGERRPRRRPAARRACEPRLAFPRRAHACVTARRRRGAVAEHRAAGRGGRPRRDHRRHRRAERRHRLPPPHEGARPARTRAQAHRRLDADPSTFAAGGVYAVGVGPVTGNFDPARVVAAHRALSCPPLARLLRATTDPMSPWRFARNLVDAWSLTALRVPADAGDAAQTLCATTPSARLSVRPAAATGGGVVAAGMALLATWRARARQARRAVP